MQRLLILNDTLYTYIHNVHTYTDVGMSNIARLLNIDIIILKYVDVFNGNSLRIFLLDFKALVAL